MTRVPPLLLAAGAAAAQGLIARGSASTALSRATAGAMAAASAGLLLSSTTAFRRRGTTVDPLAVDRAEALVTTGPFRLTRNPMYTVMAGLLLAHAALRRSWAALLPAAVGAAGLVVTAVAQDAVDGRGVRLDAPVPLAVAALLALLIGWWGPGGPSLRRGSRSLVRSVTGVPVARVVITACLVVFAVGVLGALAVGALEVSWWPDVQSPMPSPEQLPSR